MQKNIDYKSVLIIQTDGRIGGLQKISQKINSTLPNSTIYNYADYRRNYSKNIFFRVFIALLRICRLLFTCADEKYKIIIINGSSIIWLTLLIYPLNKKIILRDTSDLKQFKALNKYKFKLNRISYRLADKIIVQSRKLKRQIYFTTSLDNTYLLPNYISWVRDARNVDSKKLKFLLLGTLDENKRPSLAINFLKNNLNQNAFTIDIYGDGPLKEALYSDYANSNILFHGYKSIIDIFSVSYDYIILSSKFEASPNNLREAFAHSIPALIADDLVGGVKEFSTTTSIFVDFFSRFNGDLFTYLKSRQFQQSEFKKNCGDNFDFTTEIRNLIEN